MTYLVEVEHNYKPFQKCIGTVTVDVYCKTPFDYVVENGNDFQISIPTICFLSPADKTLFLLKWI